MRRCLWGLVLLGACAEPTPEKVPEDTDVEPPIQVPDPEPGTLVRTVELPVGDPDCEYGGVRIDVGVDDGSRDGVPGDGILQDGEVRASDVVCNGVGDPAESAMPEGPAGDGVADLSGGGGGGHAGSLDVQLTGGLASELSLWSTGAVDASWQVPTASWGLGTSPVVVDADLALRIISDLEVGALDPDTLFLTEDGEMMWWDGARSFRPSGLHVMPGVELSAPAGVGEFTLIVNTDLVLEGTLVAPGRDLDIRCRNFFMGSGARLDVSADSGGDVSIVASVQTLGLTTGLVHVDGGTIDTSGQDGDGGDVDMVVANALWWRGAFIGDGGTSGAGGDLALDVGSTAFLDGAWSSVGVGGEGGGSWEMSATEVRLLGVVDLSGGDCADCDGGRGGEMTLIGTSLAADVEITARGGEGLAIAGDAGEVDLAVYGDAALLDLAGSVTLVGGTSADGRGGDGGRLFLSAEDPRGGASALRWVGLGSLVARGGDGVEDGGQGGDVVIEQRPRTVSGAELPVGLTRITVPVDLRGGMGDFAGDGGDLRVLSNSNADGGRARVEVSAPLDVRGADGVQSGGDGGSVWLSGDAGVVRQGDIQARAGDASGTSTAGGDASAQTAASASVELWSERGPVLSIGRIDVRGGHALIDGDGGESGGVVLYGTTVAHEGDIDARGGNGAGVDSQGAAGGVVSLFSTTGSTQNAAGQIAVAGGTGTFEGALGTVLEDGFDTTVNWTP